jgi:hypothetical protein
VRATRRGRAQLGLGGGGGVRVEDDARVGDDMWVPAVSLIGRGRTRRGLARLAGPAGSVWLRTRHTRAGLPCEKEAGCCGLLLLLGCSAGWAAAGWARR